MKTYGILNNHKNNSSSPAVSLGYRFLALRDFKSTAIDPPVNMSWHFLFLHTLVYEQVAVLYPDQCGLTGKSKQQVQTIVNKDLKRLCLAIMSTELDRDKLRSFKVSLHLLFSLNM
jgi:hypothetical protein